MKTTSPRLSEETFSNILYGRTTVEDLGRMSYETAQAMLSHSADVAATRKDALYLALLQVSALVVNASECFSKTPGGMPKALEDEIRTKAYGALVAVYARAIENAALPDTAQKKEAE